MRDWSGVGDDVLNAYVTQLNEGEIEGLIEELTRAGEWHIARERVIARRGAVSYGSGVFRRIAEDARVWPLLGINIKERNWSGSDARKTLLQMWDYMVNQSPGSSAERVARIGFSGFLENVGPIDWKGAGERLGTQFGTEWSEMFVDLVRRLGRDGVYAEDMRFMIESGLRPDARTRFWSLVAADDGVLRVIIDQNPLLVAERADKDMDAAIERVIGRNEIGRFWNRVLFQATGTDKDRAYGAWGRWASDKGGGQIPIPSLGRDGGI